MPNTTSRSGLFSYPPDKPSLFDPRDFSSSGRESSEPFSPHDTPRIPPPQLRNPPGNRGPLWNRPQTQHHQLPMFMSAREIQQQYQPLEGDRQESYDWREGQPTGRSRNTAGQPNERLSTGDAAWARRRGDYETGVTTHYRTSQPETDQQVWDRKLDEALMPHHEYREVHQGWGASGGSAATPGWETLAGHSSAPQPPGTGAEDTSWERHHEAMDEYVGMRQEQHREDRWEAENWSLHDKLREAMRPGGEGYTSVVHLGTGGPQGQSDKPMVYGAHHRIAAMADIAPDRLLPVLHHRQFGEARQMTGKQNPAWRYS